MTEIEVVVVHDQRERIRITEAVLQGPPGPPGTGGEGGGLDLEAADARYRRLSESIPDIDIPASIARDTEVASAVAAAVATLDGRLDTLEAIDAATSAELAAEAEAREDGDESTAAAAASALVGHATDTTGIHGIADTSLLETTSGAQDKANAARDQAVSTILGGAPPALLDTLAELAAALEDEQDATTAFTTAISLRALDADVVHDTGNETVAGTKTFTNAPVVPDASWTISKTSGLQSALDWARDALAECVFIAGPDSPLALLADIALTGTGDAAALTHVTTGVEALLLASGKKQVITDGTFNLLTDVVFANRAAWQGVAVGSLGRNSTTFVVGPACTVGISWEGLKTRIGTNPVSTNITAGSRTIALNVDLTASLAVGDTIMLGCDDLFNAERSNQKIGEGDLVVEAITSTTLTLTTAVEYAYTAATTVIFRYDTLDDLVVGDLGFQMSTTQPAAGVRPILGQFRFCRRLQLHGTHASGKWAKHGLRLEECFGTHTADTWSYSVYDANNTTGFEGYGLYVLSCVDAVIERHSGTYDRHAHDVNGFSSGSNYRPVARDIVFIDPVARNTWNTGHSSHGGCDRVTWLRPVCRRTGGGISVRGKRPRIVELDLVDTHYDKPAEYPTSESAVHAIVVGESVNLGAGGPGGQGFWATIRRAVYNDKPNRDIHALYAIDSMTDAYLGLGEISGTTAEVVNLTSLVVERMVIEGDGVHVIDMVSTFTDSGTYQNAVVRHVPATLANGNRANDLTVRNLLTKNHRGPFLHIAGNSVAGANAGSVYVHDLKAQNLSSGYPAANKLVKFVSGHFARADVTNIEASGVSSADFTDFTGATIVTTRTGQLVTDAELAELVDDRVNALLVEGSGITKVYDDTAGTLTLSSTGGGAAFDLAQSMAFGG